jgi:hypothetical protein
MEGPVNNKSLEELIPLFWQRLEYMNAWRMCFEDPFKRLFLLKRVLQHVPEERGAVEFFENYSGNRFLLLLTYNLNNVASYENAAWILTVLAETGAVTTLGVEGAFGPFDFAELRSFPDFSITREVALKFLKTRRMAPPSFIGITAVHPIQAFGIDDEALYKAVEPLVLTEGPKYWDAVERRVSLMLENTLRLMEEKNLSILGVFLTDYNFHRFHRLLRDRRIAHAGICPTDSGENLPDMWTKIFEEKKIPEEQHLENLRKEFSGEQQNPFRKLIRKWWP